MDRALVRESLTLIGRPQSPATPHSVRAGWRWDPFGCLRGLLRDAGRSQRDRTNDRHRTPATDPRRAAPVGWWRILSHIHIGKAASQ